MVVGLLALQGGSGRGPDNDFWRILGFIVALLVCTAGLAMIGYGIWDALTASE